MSSDILYDSVGIRLRERNDFLTYLETGINMYEDSLKLKQ